MRKYLTNQVWKARTHPVVRRTGILALLVCLGVAACAPASSPFDLTRPADFSTPTAALPDACIPSGTTRETVKVTRVIDGDTIEVEWNEKKEKVRLIGIDTPELDDSREEMRAQAQRAKEFTEKQVANQAVTLVKDVSEVDQYGRLLRYVVVDGTFLNRELVALGFAESFTYPPDVACAKVFNHSEELARSAGIGIWAP